MSQQLQDSRMEVAQRIEDEQMMKLRKGMLVSPRSTAYPCFRPCPRTACLYSYGQGNATPYPNVLVLDENLGKVWEIIMIWNTNWLALKNVNTGQVVFSVPPTSVIP